MILLVDLDHTVADAAWRDNLMGEWHRYHSASMHDAPIEEVCRLVRDLQAAGWQAIGFTMRPARYRLMTNTWLTKRAKLFFPEILMREPDCWEPSAEAKCRLFDERFPDHDQAKQPIILLDDHPEVCGVFAKRNVTVLQVSARKAVKKAVPDAQA